MKTPSLDSSRYFLASLCNILQPNFLTKLKSLFSSFTSNNCSHSSSLQLDSGSFTYYKQFGVAFNNLSDNILPFYQFESALFHLELACMVSR